MNRLLIILFLAALTNIQIAMADGGYCTEWTRRDSTTCIFAGKDGDVWERQCENPCHFREYGKCDVEIICLTPKEDPNHLTSMCTDWVLQRGTLCRNPNTDRLEKKWERACQKRLATTWCSNENPNNR